MVLETLSLRLTPVKLGKGDPELTEHFFENWSKDISLMESFMKNSLKGKIRRRLGAFWQRRWDF